MDAGNLIDRYWPPCSHGSIILTTQDREMRHRARSQLFLRPLTMEQGSKLLRYYLPESHASNGSADDLCCRLSAEVQGLPLLLVGVAGHIMDSSLSLSETLDDLRESWTNSNNIIENISPESATFQYQRPIHTAFNMSLSRLNPAARNVLRIMSMLSPVGILEEIVCSDLEEHSLSFLGYQNKPR